MRHHTISMGLLAIATSSARADTPARPKTLDVESSAFAANGAIPSEYTCEGSEATPPLRWSNIPREARSIAIVVEDPDAPKGTFTHWIVTGIPATTTALAGALPAGASAGRNDFGKTGWSGPCPPSGRHRYVFRVYALDIPLAKQLAKADFAATIAGHVVAQGELVGTYQKQK